MLPRISLRRTLSVARKELLHVLRDPATLFFALLIPVMQTFLLGYAIDTNVRHVRTAVVDQAGTQESQEFLRGFVNSEDFDIVAVVADEAALHREIVSGRARVGILIPHDYSRKIQAGETAQVLVLVDGSESSVAGEVLNVSNALALRESLKQALGERALPVETRPRVLFNPDTRTANFILPGLLVVLCQFMATALTAKTIVREKENGTFEQLSLTPLRPAELLLGKLTPYLVLTCVEFVLILLLMVTVYGVPLRGQPAVLAMLALPFLVAMLGMGLIVSTRASSQDAANHMVQGTIIPSVFLSGYVFPLDSMPWVFQGLARGLPTTWLIDGARGVILRGAGWSDLWLHAVVLWVMAGVVLGVGVAMFRKQAS
jgi:ABC-2 type transport system permease protein